MHGTPGGDRQRVHPDIRLDRHVGLGGAADLGGPGHVRLAQVAVRAHEVELGTIGIEQADRALDDVLQEIVGRADRREPGGQLAQGALGVGPPGDLGPRPGELVDEAGVADRDRGLAGEAPRQGDLVVAERVLAARVDADDADGAARVDERRRDHRPDAHPPDERVRALRMDERVVGQVVAGDEDVAGRRSLARRCPRPARARGAQELPALVVGQPGVVGPLDPAGRRVHEVQEGAVGVEQAHRDVDGGAEDRGRVVERGEGRPHRAQRALDLHPPGEVGLGPASRSMRSAVPIAARHGRPGPGRGRCPAR